MGFVAAVNAKLGLLIAYCFKRSDFPWVAIWEENMGIAAPPWKQRTRARGLEFSTTPLPVLRRDAFLSGRLFDEPTMTCVPAMGSKSVRYLALLTKIPARFRQRHRHRSCGQSSIYSGKFRKEPIAVKASGIREILD